MCPGFLGQWFNNLWRQWFNNLQRTALLTSLVQYDRILGQQQLFMVNYVCGFNQLEMGKYLEWIIIIIIIKKPPVMSSANYSIVFALAITKTKDSDRTLIFGFKSSTFYVPPTPRLMCLPRLKAGHLYQLSTPSCCISIIHYDVHQWGVIISRDTSAKPAQICVI